MGPTELNKGSNQKKYSESDVADKKICILCVSISCSREFLNIDVQCLDKACVLC
jgi:hypothetical protein